MRSSLSAISTSHCRRTACSCDMMPPRLALASCVCVRVSARSCIFVRERQVSTQLAAETSQRTGVCERERDRQRQRQRQRQARTQLAAETSQRTGVCV